MVLFFDSWCKTWNTVSLQSCEFCNHLLIKRKPWSFYKLGLSPVVFSQAQHQKTGNGWSRLAENILYGPSSVYDVSSGVLCKLYCLTFYLRFNYDDDFITISSGLPYSYSRLTRQLKELKFTA